MGDSFFRRIAARTATIFTCIVLALVFASIYAAAQGDPAAQITAPQEGQALVGVVTITGTASHPNFQRYRLDFAPQGDDEGGWFQIVEITQQVANGPLAQWNTANVPDGAYQLRLRVILRDGTVVQQIVGNLAVNNTQATPLPTALSPATLPPTTLPPTEGPSPTPLIQQPPTLTPRPTIANPGGAAGALPQPTESSGTGQNIQAVLVLQTLQNAFCSGVYIAIAGFVLLGVYRLVYVRLRPALRRMAMRDE